MAVQTRVRKIARNPKRAVRRRNSRPRKRLTAKQIKFFGTARQRAALKANRRRRRRVISGYGSTVMNRRKVKSNTHHKTRVVYRTRTRKAKAVNPRRRRARRNPAPVILTLGASNPRKKRRNSMAKQSKTANRRRRNTRYTHRAVARRTRSRNPRRVHVYSRRRKSNPRRRMYARRRNPMTLFGGSGTKHTVEVVGGVLAGMAGTKFVPTLLPSSLSALGGSTIGPVVVSGLTAYALKKLAEMVKKGAFADAVFLGGLAQTGSVLLNALMPSIWGQFGVSGLGAFVPGRFPVPMNPVTAGQMAAGASMSVGAPTARIGTSGLGRAFRSAF